MNNEPYNPEAAQGPNLKQGKPKGVMAIAVLILLLAGYSLIDFIRFKSSHPLAYEVSSGTGVRTINLILIILFILLGLGLWKLNKLALWLTVILAIFIIFNDAKTLKKEIPAKFAANKSFQELINQKNSTPLLQPYVAQEEENRKISQDYFNKEIAERTTESIVAAIVAIYLLLPSTRNRF